MYYQLKKIYQQKQIISSIILFLLVVFIFVSPKLPNTIYNVQLRSDIFIYFFLLFFSFFFKLKNFNKNDLIIIISFFIINFFLSFYENTHIDFLKQFILISIIYISLKNYSENFDELKFINFYQKIGFIVLLLGYVIYFFSFSQSMFFDKFFGSDNYNFSNFFSDIASYKEDYIIFSEEILQIKSPGRFQSVCSEPATYSILISPLLYFYLKDIKKNIFKILLVFFSIILSQSVYGFLGIALCVFSVIKINYKSIFIIFLLIIFAWNLPDGKIKYLLNKSFSALNIGYDDKAWERQILVHVDNYNADYILNRFRFYQSDFFPEISDDDREFLSSFGKNKITAKEHEDSINIKKIISIFNKYDYYLYYQDNNYIRTSGCAYLANLFVSIENLKNFRIFGSGIGSHETIYKNNIKYWDYIKTNSAHCLSLNYKDGKSYFIRIHTDLGIIGLFLFIYLFVRIKNSNKDIEIFSKILLLLLFLQTGNYGLLKINIIILLLVKNSNIKNLFLKFQKNH